MPLVAAAKLDIKAPSALLDDKAQLLVQITENFRSRAKREHVLRLGEAAALDQPLIVGRVVGHHEIRRLIEALDEQSRLVVHRRVCRTAQFRNAALGEPVADRGKEPRGDLLIIDGLEKTEKTSVLLVLAIVAVIENRHHAADRLAAR